MADYAFSRRSFLSAGGLLLAGALIDRSVGWAFPTLPSIQRRTVWAMGGWNVVEVECEDLAAAEDALQKAVNAIRYVDQTYSTFDSRSILSRVNRPTRGSVSIDDESVLRTIERTLQLSQDTGGTFDPTVEPLMQRWGFRDGIEWSERLHDPRIGSQGVVCDRGRGRIELHDGYALDPGGWAKGYAAECAVEAAMAAGAIAAQANCGFDIVRSGCSPWECLIRDPNGRPDDVALSCRNSYRAVATTANTETYRLSPHGRRIGHVMDPRTGEPVESDLLSVTVFAIDGLTADALSSALFVMGATAARTWLSSHDEYAAVLMEPNWESHPDKLFVSASLDPRPMMPGGTQP